MGIMNMRFVMILEGCFGEMPVDRLVGTNMLMYRYTDVVCHAEIVSASMMVGPSWM